MTYLDVLQDDLIIVTPSSFQTDTIGAFQFETHLSRQAKAILDNNPFGRGRVQHELIRNWGGADAILLTT
jgi:hypothetical protein